MAPRTAQPSPAPAGNPTGQAVSRTTRASDEALAERAQSSGVDADRARAELLDRYRPLVGVRAGGFARRGGRSRDDLTSAGFEGLLKAIRDFDHERGVPFAAYATAKVHGEMLRWLRDTRYTVHVPRTLHERFMQVRRVDGDLQSELRRAPTIREVATRLGLADDEVVEALAVGSVDRARRAVLTSAIAGEVGDPVPDLDLAAAVAALPGRFRLVIQRRYVDGSTQAEVGREIGLSQAQVSRIEHRALASLRRILRGATRDG